MNEIVSEDFGLYRVKVMQSQEGNFFWYIHYMDDDGGVFGSEGNGEPYSLAYDALKAAMLRLADLFRDDGGLETIAAYTSEGKSSLIAGNGIRTHDILLGNFSLMSSPSEKGGAK